jgi:hypothetical protein
MLTTIGMCALGYFGEFLIRQIVKLKTPSKLHAMRGTYYLYYALLLYGSYT